MKARTMIYLDSEELKGLRSEAKAQGISMAELVRRLVRDHLSRHRSVMMPKPQVYLRIVGIGVSGQGDISERHDSYLGEVIRREHSR
jgi:hypothetical protein